MIKKIKIGSRKSKLALWQSEAVAKILNQHGLTTEIITTETRGDKILDVSISKIGSKGVFTEEIEMMLKNRDIDIAVHSAKDMPATLPKGFDLIAFTKREKANDVLVSDNPFVSLKNMDKPLCVGTSSVRRVAMLRHFYPHVKIVDMRGNLQTRIEKMKSGVCDALMLAYAGVKRMNYEHMIVGEMSTTEFVPSVGQGSIAIEVFKSTDPKDRDLKEKIRKCLNHPPTEAILMAERAFLKELEGGCSIPAFAMAQSVGDTIELTAGVISIDGHKILKQTVIGAKQNAQELGKKAGIKILENGGIKILNQIRKI